MYRPFFPIPEPEPRNAAAGASSGRGLLISRGYLHPCEYNAGGLNERRRSQHKSFVKIDVYII